MNDNADTLRDYLINLSHNIIGLTGSGDTNIIGLTGSADLIKHTADLFGAFYSDKDANTHTTWVC